MASTRKKKRSRKHASRKLTSKKRVRKNSSRKKVLKYRSLKRLFEWDILVIVFAIVLGVIAYCLHFCLHQRIPSYSDSAVAKHIVEEQRKSTNETKKAIVRRDTSDSMSTNKTNVSSSKRISSNLRLPSKNAQRSKEDKFPKHVRIRRFKQPQLVIVIDDVHTSKQLSQIEAIGYPVTPSIFPPYTLFPHTERLAKGLRHYMIHLPMESGSVKFNSQSYTLMRRFDSKQLESKIARLRRLFPHAKAINNHTGSRFTSDKAAMRRLYPVLRKYGFVFVDSRTSPHTKVASIVRSYGDDYLHRDIFIDNIRSVPAITAQLQKAVRIAIKRGYAIAIGHPYPETIEALRRAKGLLTQVKLRYMDEIYREEIMSNEE